ncbi:MAG: PIN domain-containing protein [Anaerolineae bacterium]|nr:PIN domain-containing protein [Anaerolineae bacterium]
MAKELYVFDTNIVSSLLYERQRSLLMRIRRNQTDLLILCDSVIYEVERGLNHKRAERQLSRFRDEVFPMFTVASIQLADWHVAAVLWASTRDIGKQLSDVDLLIAAMALRLNGIVVTNDKDFAYLPMVRTENWLQEG